VQVECAHLAGIHHGPQRKGVLKGGTSEGDISISNCDGDINLETFGGSLRADSCAGTIGMRTSCGGINFSAITGDVDVSTSAGDVRIRMLAEKSAHGLREGHGLRMRGSNEGVHVEFIRGDISVILPPSVAGNIDARLLPVK